MSTAEERSGATAQGERAASAREREAGARAGESAALAARVAELERALADLERTRDDERRELAAELARVEAEVRALLWSRRYRFANVVASLAHRVLPRAAWSTIGRVLRRAHPHVLRAAGDAAQPGTLPSLDRLALLARAETLGTSELAPIAGLLRERPPTVVVTVHDAPDALERCLASLERHLTFPGATVLVVDDASRLDATRALLQRFAGLRGARVLRHAENQGYTRSANDGLTAAPGDVVLLNSDVEVGPRFVEELALAAYSRPRVASVTAVSDDAGAFSVPEAETRNALPADRSLEDCARALLQHGSRELPDVPTGNGFCTYLRRAAIEDVGAFDERAFPRGYGEENDWCLRALARGWTHLVAPRVLVKHGRSRSFGAEERERLARRAMAVLSERHPGYGDALAVMRRSPELARARTAARAALAIRALPRPRVLYVLHEDSGGMPWTCHDLMAGVEHAVEPYVLRSDGRLVEIARVESGVAIPLQRVQLDEPLSAARPRDERYRAFVSQCLAHHAIELVHVHHLAAHGLDAPAIAHALAIPVVLTFHDYHLACPTTQLLDERDRFCAGRCTEGEGRCRVPTRWAGALPPLKHAHVRVWRELVRERVLPHVDAFVAPSDAARAIVTGVYPELAARTFEVVANGRDLARADRAAPPRAGERMRVLVLGALTPAKGAALAREIARLDGGRRLELHVLGPTDRELAGIGVEHGAYERGELEARLDAIRPSVVALLSIWAETWSHTLSEAWAAGIPVVATDLGAPAERVRASGAGWLVPHDDPARIVRVLEEIADRPADWREKAERARSLPLRSVAAMASDTLALYRRAWASRRALASGR